MAFADIPIGERTIVLLSCMIGKNGKFTIALEALPLKLNAFGHELEWKTNSRKESRQGLEDRFLNIKPAEELSHHSGVVFQFIWQRVTSCYDSTEQNSVPSCMMIEQCHIL